MAVECYLAASKIAWFYQLGNITVQDIWTLLNYSIMSFPSSNVYLLVIAVLQTSVILFLFLLSFKLSLFFYSNHLLANNPFFGLTVLGGL